MIDINHDYIVDEKSEKKAVIIPISDWKRIITKIEELEDIQMYDAVKSKNEETIPFEQAVQEIESGFSE